MSKVAPMPSDDSQPKKTATRNIRARELVRLDPKSALQSRRGFVLLLSTLAVLVYSVFRMAALGQAYQVSQRLYVETTGGPYAHQLSQLLRTSVSSTYAVGITVSPYSHPLTLCSHSSALTRQARCSRWTRTA